MYIEEYIAEKYVYPLAAQYIHGYCCPSLADVLYLAD
jgi:hypothetical protein